MSTVIKVENVSKLYRLGEIGTGSMQADLKRFWYKMRGKEDPFWRIGESNDRSTKGNSDYVWSLKDINFEIQRGEAVGIIGRNGAGKSTLLKLLSRVTAPTTGSIKAKGRIASLLEVGTGFHPELTGRENIFINGAFLGMRKHEIKRHFDAIVDFSGVERYIDTPVKRYSSGMYVRLAFAVAAHLESEILIVDEVLAVGDAEFQKKCMGKMKDVSDKEGRTVLFVSHNMAAVLSLCNKAYLLESGQLKYSGPVETAVMKYLEVSSSTKELSLADREDRHGNGTVQLTSIDLKTPAGDSIIRCGDSLTISLKYKAASPIRGANFLLRIVDELNRPISFLDSKMAGQLSDILPAEGTITCTTGAINITPGFCVVNVAIIVDGELADQVKQAISFNVEVSNFFGTGKMLTRQDGILAIEQEWDSKQS